MIDAVKHAGFFSLPPLDVLKKEVKKPSGAKPGFVVYYTNYSMTVVPKIDGLKEIHSEK